MKIKNQITLDLPVEVVWDAVNDVPRVARCAPGAELLESREDGSHVGTVAVRLGPVALKFKGTVRFVEVDPATRTILADARGNEEKGKGAATANVTFRLTSEGDKTVVKVDSDLVLVGAVAQYGRGTAIVQGTAQALMTDFAKNLEADLKSGGAETGSSRKEISAARTLAKGLFNAGANMLKPSKDE